MSIFPCFMLFNEYQFASSAGAPSLDDTGVDPLAGGGTVTGCAAEADGDDDLCFPFNLTGTWASVTRPRPLFKEVQSFPASCSPGQLAGSSPCFAPVCASSLVYTQMEEEEAERARRAKRGLAALGRMEEGGVESLAAVIPPPAGTSPAPC